MREKYKRKGDDRRRDGGGRRGGRADSKGSEDPEEAAKEEYRRNAWLTNPSEPDDTLELQVKDTPEAQVTAEQAANRAQEAIQNAVLDAR